jgi:hypothetical protein
VYYYFFFCSSAEIKNNNKTLLKISKRSKKKETINSANVLLLTKVAFPLQFTMLNVIAVMLSFGNCDQNEPV